MKHRIQELKKAASKSSSDRYPIAESEAYQKFHDCALGKRPAPDYADWLELRKAVNAQHPSFDETLIPLNLSETEYQVSLLLKCNFKPKSISVLTYQSKESVTSIRRRLCQKHLQIEHPRPKDWDNFILSL